MQHNKTVDVQCDRPMKWLNLHDGLIYKFSYGDCYVRGYVRASQCCPYVYCRYWILPLKNCRHVSHRGIISHRIILVIKNWGCRINFKNENSVLEGIDFVIQKIKETANYSSFGFDFLVGNPLKRDKNGKIKDSNAPYKRWNMFLLWMLWFVTLDLGLWKKIDKKDLILPLDTHTFKVSKKLGLLENRTYNLKSALEISQKLKEFDANDPIKYDFAIYRLGQEKII